MNGLTKFLMIGFFIVIVTKAVFSDEVNDFFNAATAGDSVKVKSLLSKNPKLINVKDKEGETALLLAANGLYLDLVILLISSGADVNAKNNAGFTVMMYAVGISEDETGPNSRDSIEIVKFLVSHGADVNSRDNAGITVLLFAAAFSKIDTIKFLVEKGAGVNANSDDCCGITALMVAVENRNRNLIVFFIEKGADVNAMDRDGNTALKIATEKGYTDIADLLRKHGAKE